MTRVADYRRVRSVREAVSIAAQCERPRFLAGGTDLLVTLPHEASEPVTLVDISDVPELGRLELNDRGLTVGAAVPMADVIRPDLAARGYGALCQGAAEIGSPQIRNLATLGGNVCNASPSGDTLAPLLSFNAEAHLVSVRGERRVPLTDFFRGPGKTVLEERELLASLFLPAPLAGSTGTYFKLKVREALDLAIVGVSVVLGRNHHGWDARIALAGVGPVPFRASEAEALLRHSPRIGQETIREAAQLAEAAARPISDVRGSAQYRKAMVRQLTKRALRQALEALAC